MGGAGGHEQKKMTFVREKHLGSKSRSQENRQRQKACYISWTKRGRKERMGDGEAETRQMVLIEVWSPY